MGPGDLHLLIATYGYAAVFVVVALESAGLPLPGETTLIAAALIAATGHDLDIGGVVLAAAAGAMAGDNMGYLVGRRFGLPLLERHGGRIGLTPTRLKIGRYLFREHGGTIVIVGRFIALLRAVTAVLAGANAMPWGRFVLFNGIGAALWASAVGLAAYGFGDAALHAPLPLRVASVALAGALVVGGGLWIRQQEGRLAAVAEAAMPDEDKAITPPSAS